VSTCTPIRRNAQRRTILHYTILYYTILYSILCQFLSLGLRHSSSLRLSLCSLTSCLAPAPLKLRPYGAIQICLLLLLLLLFLAHQHKACRQLKIKQEMLQWVINRWQWTCWGRRPHFPVEGQWTGAGTKILSLCCPQWHYYYYYILQGGPKKAGPQTHDHNAVKS